jgi:hypothetical protein
MTKSSGGGVVFDDDVDDWAPPPPVRGAHCHYSVVHLLRVRGLALRRLGVVSDDDDGVSSQWNTAMTNCLLLHYYHHYYYYCSTWPRKKLAVMTVGVRKMSADEVLAKKIACRIGTRHFCTNKNYR